MVKFSVFAACLFSVFCVCPNFDDLAKQRRKFFWGVSEVEKKTISLFIFVGCASLSWFFFSAAIARDTSNYHSSPEKD